MALGHYLSLRSSSLSEPGCMYRALHMVHGQHKCSIILNLWGMLLATLHLQTCSCQPVHFYAALHFDAAFTTHTMSSFALHTSPSIRNTHSRDPTRIIRLVAVTRA